MAFKNLQERFLAAEKALYSKYSTKDGSPNQPYLEFKPTDPTAEDTRNDSRFLPIGSVKRDTIRLGTYLKSNDGLLWLASQEIMQTGNTFSETRLFNPLFVIGNVVPGLHISRILTGQNDFAVKGDQSQISPASLDPQIFSAGRLQKDSSTSAINRVVGNGGASGLLSLFNLSQLTKAVTSVFGITNAGTLGVNERPEFNVDGNGEYFSVASWKGFTKLNSPQNNLSAAAANLRVGNIVGAASSLKNAFTSVITGVKKRIPSSPLAPDGRDTTASDFDGRRYFFTVGADDERYIQNSIEFSTDAQGRDRPVVSMQFVNRQPYIIDTSTAPALPFTTPTVPNLSSQVKKIGASFGSVAGALSNGLSFNAAATQVALQSLNSATTNTPTGVNAAEDSMHFANLSLRQRYNDDERLNFIRTTIQAQKDKSFAYWNGKSSLQSLGLKESNNYAIGKENDIDPTIFKGGRYLSDVVNNSSLNIKTSGDGLDDDGLDAYQTAVGTDTVLVIFYDFKNQTAIPFRALLTNLTETITPEITDTRYVGRIERNIVYSGATREVSFQLTVQAYNQTELGTIWQKVNHMTGLCFPADYSNGFIVPPFVKLTLGSIYRDQPGYLRALSHTIEDGTPW
jgi:hypothetical protein